MTVKNAIPSHILPVIVFAQFAGTSLWFAGNAVAGDLQKNLGLEAGATGNITSAVQLGFIAGTLVFAFLSIADRFSPSKVFLASALAGALFNLPVIWLSGGLFPLLLLRFLTGFFLAGIYPVGMKISADWYEKGLGKTLGYLVGALVLGTAFPHLLKDFTTRLMWHNIILATSTLATTGGILLFLTVPDGPHRRPAAKFEWDAIPQIFRFKNFRAAASGYFGHMWELYTMWAFVPLMLLAYNETRSGNIQIPLWSFFIIGIGSIGCVAGGYISLKKGSPKVAFWMLLISGVCCLLSPVFFLLPQWLFLSLLLLWGFAVVGDSPQFSSVVASAAPENYTGTALTIVNCIGFALTIFSIQLFNWLQSWLDARWWYLFLLPGPVFGLMNIRRILK